MNTNFSTAITNILDGALAELANLHQALLAKSNEEKAELLAILAKMQRTQANATEIASVCTDVAEKLVEVATDNIHLAQMIGAAIESPLDNCPDGPFEELVGFCDDCGKEITTHDYFYEDDDGMGIVCGECADKTCETSDED